jgi:3-dehydroquinate synthase
VNDVELTIELGERSYPIRIGTGGLAELGTWIQSRRRTTHVVLITDDHVVDPHANIAAESLVGTGVAVDMVVVDPGEPTKSVDMAEQLWEKLAAVGCDRKSVVVAVGGGVVGDLAGFVAATYARGLDFVQVPTTLLAQVDSSVGGKVGINLPQAKNMVGAFWQPLGVLIDTSVLATLPDREYRSGLAEVVKYGVILDEEFFDFCGVSAPALAERDDETLRHAILRSCQLKGQVVQHDERETSGHRAVLNYGHTFAHAFEAATNYGKLLHGEAVAMGMMCAARLAERLRRIQPNFVERQRAVLDRLGLPTEPPALDPEALLAVMARDKKVEHGQLRFVLPTRIGHVELVGGISADDVRAVLAPTNV